MAGLLIFLLLVILEEVFGFITYCGVLLSYFVGSCTKDGEEENAKMLRR